MFPEVQFILFVADQDKATAFYQQVLGMSPSLNVPGMTEFSLNQHTKLGLMPANGIAKIITPAMNHPNVGTGIPRAELYLKFDRPHAIIDLAIDAGASLISGVERRDWGDRVGYIADVDGHVLAIAEKQD